MGQSKCVRKIRKCCRRINWKSIISLIGVILGFASVFLTCLVPVFGQYFHLPGCPEDYRSKIKYSKLSESAKKDADKTCNLKFFNTHLCEFSVTFSRALQLKVKRSANEEINTEICPPMWLYIAGVATFGVTWFYTVPLLLVFGEKLPFRKVGGHFGILVFIFFITVGIGLSIGFSFWVTQAKFPCYFIKELKKSKNFTVYREHFYHAEPYKEAKFPGFKDTCPQIAEWVYRLSLLWSGNILAVIAVVLILTGGCMYSRESTVKPEEEEEEEEDEQKKKLNRERNPEIGGRRSDLEKLDEILDKYAYQRDMTASEVYGGNVTDTSEDRSHLFYKRTKEIQSKNNLMRSLKKLKTRDGGNSTETADE